MLPSPVLRGPRALGSGFPFHSREPGPREVHLSHRQGAPELGCCRQPDLFQGVPGQGGPCPVCDTKSHDLSVYVQREKAKKQSHRTRSRSQKTERELQSICQAIHIPSGQAPPAAFHLGGWGAVSNMAPQRARQPAPSWAQGHRSGQCVPTPVNVTFISLFNPHFRIHLLILEKEKEGRQKGGCERATSIHRFPHRPRRRGSNPQPSGVGDDAPTT